MKKTVVSIGIVTYNHELYIEECLDSILCQCTDYSYEIVVADDASTDSTPEILLKYKERYPDIFNIIIQKQNVGIGENYKSLFQNFNGEYVMLCEGDDYWINPLKIQLQISFMKSFSKYGFTSGRVLWKKGDFYQERPSFSCDEPPYTRFVWNRSGGNVNVLVKIYGDVSTLSIGGVITHTSAMCFRYEFIKEYVNEVGLGLDMALQAIIANQTSFAIIEQFFSVYRYFVGISSDKQSYIRKKYYWENFWLPARRLELKILGDRCPWTAEEIEDQYIYTILKYNLRNFNYCKALNNKRLLKSKTFRSKIYSKFLNGPLSMFVLSISLLVRRKGNLI